MPPSHLATPLPQEIIRHKRDGQVLSPDHIQQLVQGITRNTWSEGQVAAMAMAVFLSGMDRGETIALTQAMCHSGEVLHWDAQVLGGPVLDKHSTGGVGDKVSLLLAPILAACGAYVPMISGRGLGHTGGTLDKLDSIPGYQTMPAAQLLRDTVRGVGCAIVGPSAGLAPADKRLYAIRDVTATVESIPLITASILSKKLAAGLGGLVVDIKVGNGAFAATPEMAQALATSLVEVANGAGLPTRALMTDMNQVLGCHCGNALEVQEAIEFLTGQHRDPRLDEVTRALCAELLLIGAVAKDRAKAHAQIEQALASGQALERFARMVANLGGPSDLVEHHHKYLPKAPVVMDVLAPCDGYLSAMATRDIGLLVVRLGGGRQKPSDAVDPRVGVANVLALGTPVRQGTRLANVHAADQAAAEQAAVALGPLFMIENRPQASPNKAVTLL